MSKQAELKVWFADNLEALKAASVATIAASWHGEGDEGEFDGIQVLDLNGNESEYLLGKAGALIEDAMRELAGDEGFSWSGFPGGGGALDCDVATGKIVYTGHWSEVVERDEEPVTL